MNVIYSSKSMKLNLSPLKSTRRPSTRNISVFNSKRNSISRNSIKEDNSPSRRNVSSTNRTHRTKNSQKREFRLSIDYRHIDAAGAIIVNKSIAPRDINNIESVLSSHFIFSHLPYEQRLGLIKHMKYYRIHAGEVVCYQGNYGNNFFIIDTGQAEVLVSNERKAVLGPGATFGDLALIQDSPRTATIRILENATLWGLDRLSFKNATQAVNFLNYEENKSFIKSVPLFQFLSNTQQDSLLECVVSLKFNPGDKIVREGDSGELFYIIKSGTASCSKNGKQLRLLTKGDFFGEQSLLYGSKRLATIAALRTVRCLAIGRKNLYRAIGSQLQHIIYTNTIRFILERSLILRKINKLQAEKVLNKLTYRTFNKGDTVISQGESKGQTLWFILKGQVITRISQTIIDKLSCIGEESIISTQHELYEDDYLAFTSLDCACILKSDFENSIGGDFNQVTTNNEAMEVISNIPIFKSLSIEKVNALIQVLKLQDYNDEEVIVEQGQLGYSFFIIKEGQVDLFQNDEFIKTISKLDYFGERSVILNERRAATIVAKGYVICWYLEKKEFERVLNDKIRTQLYKRIAFENYTQPLEELVPVLSIAKSKYGNILLVIDRINNQQYALKYYNRSLLDVDLLYRLESSESLSLLVDHPFIAKFVKSYRDSNRLYFLEEFVRGISIKSVIQKYKILSEDVTRFYVACLISILDHLHERDIIHRDLNPESIIIDEEGYPKLLNLESAKVVLTRTYTILGTPHYMAPEVICGKGYNVLTDYWSLGVIMYELLCGTLPYGDEEDDPILIYESIMKNKLLFPSWVERRLSAKPLIEQFLNKNPAIRTVGSVEILKNHAWFNKLDWEKLYDRELIAPYIPLLKNYKFDTITALNSSSTLENFINFEEELLQSSLNRIENSNENRNALSWTSNF